MRILVDILNGLIFALASGVEFITGALPKSPFSSIDITPIKEFMGYFNWLIPVGVILAILTAWIGCKMLYWCYSTVLRWIKLIS